MTDRNKPKKDAELIARVAMHCELDDSGPYIYNIYYEGDEVPENAPDEDSRGDAMYRMYVHGCGIENPRLVKIWTWDHYLNYWSDEERQQWVLAAEQLQDPEEVKK